MVLVLVVGAGAGAHSCMSLFSKAQAELSFPVSAWSLQCGQRVMKTIERKKKKEEQRDGEWGWRRVRGLADRTGDEGEGVG